MISVHRITFPSAICSVVLSLAACGNAASPSPVDARFVFREPLTSDVVRLAVTDPAGLEEAEELLQSGDERWAVGTPRRGDGGFNAPWPWHLDPATVSFAELTIEACQTRASAVEDDLDYWIEFGQVCIFGIVEARER